MPAAAACRPSICALPSMPSPPSKPRCSTCSASFWACRWPRCSGEGQQRDAVEVLGYLFYVGDRKKTDLPYRERAGCERRLAAPAPRRSADAGSRRAPRRSRACALRLQRLQAEGRRAARATQEMEAVDGAGGTLSRSAHHARSERRLVARGSHRAVPRPARRAGLRRRSVRRRERLLRAAKSWPNSAAPPACPPRPT